ncbi:MAG: YfiR family protein [Rhodoferax sp.]|uniref:YfiR family protein n=1 Tax=Rhodoferax sp. TaxID=50421 RepID=UPI00260B202D|nr:YfiR family protein [Rhodoferax sp.]MDD2879491.1 YfiR family protein [Rhodoferax sp.]
MLFVNSARQLLIVSGLLLCATGVWAQDVASVRLGFLLNFCRYTEWPQVALSPGRPLRLCLALGDEAMLAQLGELARQPVQGRPIQVSVVYRPADVSACDALYLPTDAPGALPAWLGAAQRSGVLTVSDLPDFADSGGMVGLAAVGGRYRFDINLGAARQADLRFSSQLLKLARTVR